MVFLCFDMSVLTQCPRRWTSLEELLWFFLGFCCFLFFSFQWSFFWQSCLVMNPILIVPLQKCQFKEEKPQICSVITTTVHIKRLPSGLTTWLALLLKSFRYQGARLSELTRSRRSLDLFNTEQKLHERKWQKVAAMVVSGFCWQNRSNMGKRRKKQKFSPFMFISWISNA